MYFPLGSPRLLGQWIGEHANSVICCSVSPDGRCMAAITRDAVFLWCMKPLCMVAVDNRDDDSLQLIGTNTSVVWRSSGHSLSISTTLGHAILYNVNVDNAGSAYNFQLSTDSKSVVLPGAGEGSGVQRYVMNVTGIVAIPTGVTAAIGLRDNLLLFSTGGLVQPVQWNGYIDINNVVDFTDVVFSTPPIKIRAPILIAHATYNAALQTYAFALGDRSGDAGIIRRSSSGQGFVGRWVDCGAANIGAGVEEVEATMTAINYKFTLLAVGYSSGDVCLYRLRSTSEGSPSSTGVLRLSHKLSLGGEQGRSRRQTGGVSALAWSPDQCALAVGWQTEGVAIWSTFGTLLAVMTRYDRRRDSDFSNAGKGLIGIRSLSWSAEGYSLIAVVTRTSDNDESSAVELITPSEQKKHQHVQTSVHRRDTPQFSTAPMPEIMARCSLDTRTTELWQFELMKSVLCSNPCTDNHRSAILQGSTRVYIYTDSMGDKSTGLPHDAALLPDFMWQTLPLPTEYLVDNWPVRLVAVNSDLKFVAIAGRYGLAHYSTSTGRWRLFGNRNYEQEFVVQGGLAWWEDCVVAAIASVKSNEHEVRFYPRSRNLDPASVTVTLSMPSRVVRLDIIGNFLLTVLATNILIVHYLTITATKVDVMCVVDLSLDPFIRSPFTLLGITLNYLDITNASAAEQDPSIPPASLLANVGGRLVVVPLDIYDSSQNESQDSSGINSTANSPEQRQRMLGRSSITSLSSLSGRMLSVCNDVEHFWCPTRWATGPRHLARSLCVACGVRGMRMWMPKLDISSSMHELHRPLTPVDPYDDDDDRGGCDDDEGDGWNLLTFHLDVYPLSIVVEGALIIAAAQERSFADLGNPSIAAGGDGDPLSLPFYLIHQKTQIFLPHVLRAFIIQRNEELAIEIARQCSHLPYFAHSLELVLHEVLEEEAASKTSTSGGNISTGNGTGNPHFRADAHLPRVIDFLGRFPNFLETLVTCARKTDVALWPHLFSIVGDPLNLFEQCLVSGRLVTGASYLIILQGLEPTDVFRRHAVRLCEHALLSCEWHLAKELIRFLLLIDGRDASENVSGPSVQTLPSLELNQMLRRRARSLITRLQLRQLGRFARHLNFELRDWFQRERYRAARVEDISAMLIALCGHDDMATMPYVPPRLSYSENAPTDIEVGFNPNPRIGVKNFRRVSVNDGPVVAAAVINRTGANDDIEPLGPSDAGRPDVTRVLLSAIGGGCFDWAILIVVATNDLDAFRTLVIPAARGQPDELKYIIVRLNELRLTAKSSTKSCWSGVHRFTELALPMVDKALKY